MEYIFQNPVGIATPPSAYDEDFVVASINLVVNNLELINNLILNQLVNRKLAPYRLIKKRAENKMTILSQPIAQLHSNRCIH